MKRLIAATCAGLSLLTPPAPAPPAPRERRSRVSM